MQIDFHYYATYCAAYLAGYSHDDCLTIAYSAQFVDCCSVTLIDKLNGPKYAATTQTAIELADARTDLLGLQNITRIWSSFHFLPAKLWERYPHRTRAWLRKYRLICDTNSALLHDTVVLAKDKSLQACGLAMHILADTWAHRYFAGTPSFVINNATDFYEIRTIDGKQVEKKINFNRNPATPDDFEECRYTNSLRQAEENTIMNLGHGRAGHLPDYSFIRYKFLPAWGEYKYIYKDNPSDYYHAFCQMVYAMQYLRGEIDTFRTECYAWDTVEPYKKEIMAIFEKRRSLDSEDWKAFGRKLSGMEIEDFDVSKYEEAYKNADVSLKDDTFLGKFFIAALAQKSLVTNKIFLSNNLLAGFSVDFEKNGFQGIKDFSRLALKRHRGSDHKVSKILDITSLSPYSDDREDES